jgi:hypothetical protein
MTKQLSESKRRSHRDVPLFVCEIGENGDIGRWVEGGGGNHNWHLNGPKDRRK